MRTLPPKSTTTQNFQLFFLCRLLRSSPPPSKPIKHSDAFFAYFKDTGEWRRDKTFWIISSFFSSYKIVRHVMDPHVLFWVCLFHGVLTTAVSHIRVHQAVCDTMTYIVIVIHCFLGFCMFYVQPATVLAYSILRGAQYMLLGILGVLVVLFGGPERRGDTQDQVLDVFWLLFRYLVMSRCCWNSSKN
eukprot:PhF_6_TR42993/c0_g4_i1/m.65606